MSFYFYIRLIYFLSPVLNKFAIYRHCKQISKQGVPANLMYTVLCNPNLQCFSVDQSEIMVGIAINT